MNFPDKESLRAEMLERIRHIAVSEIEHASKYLCMNMAIGNWFQPASQIGWYAARAHEPNLKYLLDLTNKPRAFPRVINEAEMDFFMVKSDIELKRGAFGILEPTSNEKITWSDKDLVLIPGLAFDRKGNRLGSGKGFYDRYLAKFPNLIKVGVCFSFQLVDAVPHEEFDIPMNYVITENQAL